MAPNLMEIIFENRPNQIVEDKLSLDYFHLVVNIFSGTRPVLVYNIFRFIS